MVLIVELCTHGATLSTLVTPAVQGYDTGMNHISKAIDEVGLAALARGCSVWPNAVLKWQRAGVMPRTEWTGETNHSAIIERLTAGKVRRSDLVPYPRPSPMP